MGEACGRGVSDFDVVVVGGGPAGAASALKCAELGLRVLLMERGGRSGSKPCGGILTPACVDLLEESLGVDLPQRVMCRPEHLALYYVPPSGRRNGGEVRGYRLYNIKRGLFDEWLRELAAEAGAEVWMETEFLGLQQSKPLRFRAGREGQTIRATSRYMVGADGVYSSVRRHIHDHGGLGVARIRQEYWRAEGEFEDCFYVFFRGDVSPTYSYVIPKDGLYVIGTGVPVAHAASLGECMGRFKDWLRDEFALTLLSLSRKEAWAIPYGFTLNGAEDVVLVGDAAGFCNPLSGEGIRFAVESGVAAGEAAHQATLHDKPIAPVYIELVQEISGLMRRLYDFAVGLTDEGREEFVRSELARIPFP
ncbi:MAG: NAD(P)/FAD-dependent oxidoreductase [Candidatus Bathyarchaeia archaeon]